MASAAGTGQGRHPWEGAAHAARTAGGHCDWAPVIVSALPSTAWPSACGSQAGGWSGLLTRPRGLQGPVCTDLLLIHRGGLEGIHHEQRDP